MSQPHDAVISAIQSSQSAFARAVMLPGTPVPEDIAVAAAAQRTKRFSVYRNNVHASLVRTVAARFPVVRRLVGDAFFDAMALEFARRFPPASPVLLEYGSAFAGFIGTFEPAMSIPYLPDIARLEWARNTAYHAADACSLPIAELGAVQPEELGAVRMVLHPSAVLVQSPYPIVSIWQTNTLDDVVQPVGPQNAAECALVTRPGQDVLVAPLPLASGWFARELWQGARLADAAHSASAVFPDFDLSAGLVSLFGCGAVVSIAVSPPPLRSEVYRDQ